MYNNYGYLRVAAAKNITTPAGVTINKNSIISLMKESSEAECDICVFPELAISSYSCSELFRQSQLLDKVNIALNEIVNISSGLNGIFIIGFPMAERGLLFNCAAVISKGNILGIVPKTYIPNNNEYYEGRWFSSGLNSNIDYVLLNGKQIPFGTNLLFSNRENKLEIFGIEICEDLWAPIPPSSYLSLAGASVIFNLSASTDILGKAEYRKKLVQQQSASMIGSYIYTSSGVGESTTDTVCSGHSIICENGKILSENIRFSRSSTLIYTDTDLDFINHERLNNSSYSQSVSNHNGVNNYRIINYSNQNRVKTLLKRDINPHPFIPGDKSELKDRSREILNIQSTGLATRLKNSGISSVVLGLSGGLDSTLALLVVLESFKQLELDTKGIHCFTLPGFGTTKRTKNNVEKLCSLLSLKLETIDISNASRQHFNDIGHDITVHDITYENTQARERTQILMDMSNKLNGIVIGTGDLSELALGWCTYNGDHMSMYSVNSGVPKTLVKFLIEYYSETVSNPDISLILNDIINTPISPELLPPDSKGEISQKTEESVGPYELHDFFLYNAIRCGFSPEKVLFLGIVAFKERYNQETISKWLRHFYKRFFSQQFKRSALPDGPKVGTLSLSPRGDWRMPSDATSAEWFI